MVSFRNQARGRDCLVRLPGLCNHMPETTVLAHFRMLPYCGTGAKMDDWFAALACSACHDEIDRRTTVLERDYVRMAHLEGIIRTQALWIKEGLIQGFS